MAVIVVAMKREWAWRNARAKLESLVADGSILSWKHADPRNEGPATDCLLRLEFERGEDAKLAKQHLAPSAPDVAPPA